MCKMLGMLNPTNPTPLPILANLISLYIPANPLPSCNVSHDLSMCIKPHRTHVRCTISVLPQTWWSPAVGWMKACLQQPMFGSRESTICFCHSVVILVDGGPNSAGPCELTCHSLVSSWTCNCLCVDLHIWRIS